mgnify:CR=1 FL=1
MNHRTRTATGMALLLAALCAQGTSVIRNIGQIEQMKMTNIEDVAESLMV